MCTACSVLPCICHSICTVNHACIVCICHNIFATGATGATNVAEGTAGGAVLGPATAMVAKPTVTPRTFVVVAAGATVPESGAVACSPSGVISKSVGAASVDAGARSGAGARAVPA